MKKIYFLAVSLIAGALAMVACSPSSDTRSELKVMSYNIRCITTTDQGELSWEERKIGSITMINQERPDIIGYQETGLSQCEYLYENLPQYDHVEIGCEEGDLPVGIEHILVMWLKEKYELLDWGYFWLSETPDEMSRGWDGMYCRAVTWVQLREKSTEKELYCFNTHYDHVGDVARYESSKLSVEKIKEIAGEDATAFLIGDFNIDLYTPMVSALTPFEGWMESVRETAPETDHIYTFTGYGRTDPELIDYIYYRNAEALKYQTLDGDYGVKYVSDHYPILGTFKF